MKEDPQEFEKLRKLLALKRHELPPPGYFDNFSDRIIGRIENDQGAQSGLWDQLVSLFAARPAISWSFSLASVVLLLAAGNAFDGEEKAQSNQVPNSTPAGNARAAASMMLSTNFNPPTFSTASLAFEPVARTGTNGEPRLDSLFSTPFYHQVQPAGFTR